MQRPATAPWPGVPMRACLSRKQTLSVRRLHTHHTVPDLWLMQSGLEEMEICPSHMGFGP